MFGTLYRLAFKNVCWLVLRIESSLVVKNVHCPVYVFPPVPRAGFFDPYHGSSDLLVSRFHPVCTCLPTPVCFSSLLPTKPVC